MSYEVPSPSESMHGRGNHDKETENLTAYTAWSIFKGKSKSPMTDVTAVEEMIVIAAAAGRAVELYGDNK